MIPIVATMSQITLRKTGWKSFLAYDEVMMPSAPMKFNMP